MLKLLMSAFILVAGAATSVAHAKEPTLLTLDNTVTLKGEVNDESVGASILRLEAAGQKSNGKTVYFVIDSNGGSVISGLALKSYLLKTHHKFECVAKTAISMAFVILQACPVRTALDDSIVMQHTASFGAEGREPNVVTFVNFIKRIALVMDQDQAIRIGLSLAAFRDLTVRDWWSFGEEALDNHVVDDIADYRCAPELYSRVITKESNTMFGSVKVNFSACPLVGVALSASMKLNPGLVPTIESEAAKQKVLDLFDVHGEALRKMNSK